MHYLVAGILKPDSDQRLQELHNEWNEHLSQPNRNVSMFGLLRDRNGERRGYLAFIEANGFDDADAYLRESPLFQHDLYERVEVAEFETQVGDFAK